MFPTLFYITHSRAGNQFELSDVKPSEARVILSDLSDTNVGIEVLYSFENDLDVVSHFSLEVEDVPYTMKSSSMLIDVDGLSAIINNNDITIEYRDVSIGGTISNDTNSFRISGFANDCPFTMEISSMTSSANEFIPQKIDAVEVDRMQLTVMSILNSTGELVSLEMTDDYLLNESFSINSNELKGIKIWEDNYPSEQLNVTITYSDKTIVTVSGHEIVTSDCFVREGVIRKNYISGDPSGAIVNVAYSAESYLIKKAPAQ